MTEMVKYFVGKLRKVSLDDVPRNIDYKARCDEQMFRQSSDKYNYIERLI